MADKGGPAATGQIGQTKLTLIKFAWTAEITGVLCGILNALYITYGDNPPPFGMAWLAATPLAVLGMTEILRIPLAQAFCQRRGFMLRAGALVMILIAGGIAVENWAFGLERIVNIRAGAVVAAKAELDDSKARLANTTSSATSAAIQNDGERGRLDDVITSSEKRVSQYGTQITEAGTTHARNLAEITDACKRIRAVCIEPRSNAEDARYQAELQRLQAAQAAAQQELSVAQTRRAAIDAAGHQQASTAQDQIAAAKRAVEEKEVALHGTARQSPIHRMGAMYFGVDPAALSDAQIGQVRGFFSLFGAICISFAGTGAAMVHFARGKDDPGRRFMEKLFRAVRAYIDGRRERAERNRRRPVEKLFRALRAYIARRRKRVIRIQEKEVPKEVVKIEKVEIPEKIVEIHKVREIVKLIPYSGGLPITEVERMPETVVRETVLGDGEAPETPEAGIDPSNVTHFSDRRRS